MRKFLWPLLLVICVGIAAYANTFSVPFQFDDFSSIVHNPVIRHLDNFFAGSKGYAYNPRRFIGYLTLALNYRIGGLDVTGYHLVNLAIHLINAVLVYFLVILTFRTPYVIKAGYGRGAIGEGGQPKTDGPSHDSRFTIHGARFIALFSALLFVSHPLQTQAVTYIVQRFTSLATLFYLLSLVLYIKGRLLQAKAEVKVEQRNFNRDPRPSFSVLASTSTLTFFFFSLLSAVCAMMTKEISFTLPVVIVLYELLFFEASMRKRLLFFLPVLATLLIIPVSIMGTHKPLGEILSDLSDRTRVQTNIPRLDYLITQIRVITTYIRLIFFPVGQNLDYDYPISRSFLTPSVFLCFLLLAALFGTAVWLLYKSRQGAEDTPPREEGSQEGSSPIASGPLPIAFHLSPIACHRLIAFGILWFFITLSVESSVIPIVDVIFEHRVYLPSVGAFIAIAGSVFLLSEYVIKTRRSPSALRGEGAVLNSPPSGGEGVVLNSPPLRGGDEGEGVGDSRLTVPRAKDMEYDDERAGAYVPRTAPYALCALLILILVAATYARNRVWQDEAGLWQDVVNKSPGGARALNNLGYLSLGRGRLDEAIGYFRNALKLNPSYAAAHANLGTAYYRKGWTYAAVGQFQTALRLVSSPPDLAEAHHNLGLAYAQGGMPAEALEEFEAALKSAPDSPEIYSDMGVIYAQRGATEKAIECYRAALFIRQDYAPAYFNLGTIYKKRGMEEAAAYLQKAHDLDPSRF
jgi:Flp pilus assembly protein TadD